MNTVPTSARPNSPPTVAVALIAVFALSVGCASHLSRAYRATAAVVVSLSVSYVLKAKYLLKASTFLTSANFKFAGVVPLATTTFPSMSLTSSVGVTVRETGSSAIGP